MIFLIPAGIAFGYLLAVFVIGLRHVVKRKPFEKTDEGFLCLILFFWPITIVMTPFVLFFGVFVHLDESFKIRKVITGPANFFATICISALDFRNTDFWKRLTMSRKVKNIRKEALKAIADQKQNNPIFRKQDEINF